MQHHPQAVLITVPQAAAMLSLSAPTIWRRVADGTIPAVRIGSATRIHRETIEALVARAKAGPRDA